MLCECFTLCVSLAAPILEANSDLPELSLLCDLMLQNQVKLTDLIDGELAVLRQGKKANFLLRAKS